MQTLQFTTKEIKIALVDTEIEEIGIESSKLYSKLGVVVRKQKLQRK